MFDTPQSDVRIIGHRGAAAVAPENTLHPSVPPRLWVIRWVEMDVSVLADGAPVIFHDEELGGTVMAEGDSPKLTSPMCSSWMPVVGLAPQFSGERIPRPGRGVAGNQRLDVRAES